MLMVDTSNTVLGLFTVLTSSSLRHWLPTSSSVAKRMVNG